MPLLTLLLSLSFNSVIELVFLHLYSVSVMLIALDLWLITLSFARNSNRKACIFYQREKFLTSWDLPS